MLMVTGLAAEPLVYVTAGRQHFNYCDNTLRRPGSHTAAGPGAHNVQAGLLQQRVGGTANVHTAATTARPTGVRLESLRPCHADPDPAALAAGQLQNKVQAVLPRPRHQLRSQPGVSDGNSPVSRRQQISCGLRSSSTSSMDYSLPRLCT